MFLRFLTVRTTLWVMIALFSAAAAAAQQPKCALKSDQLPDAPELLGFRLGMTSDQAKTRVPQIQFGRADQFGVVKTTFNPNFDPRFDKTSFGEARTISLDFLDGKLFTFWIGYEGTFKWQTGDEFVAGISKSMNLPAAWSVKRGEQQLACDGFLLTVKVIAGSPSIRIADEAAQEIIAGRREEAVAAAEAAAATVTGDKRTKLYYPADCTVPEGLPEASRVVFKDKAEAEKAGFKLAKDCE